MNSAEAVEAAVAAGADALGFVFAESPRQVTPEQANALCAGVPRARHARRRHAPPAQGGLGARHRSLRADWLQTDAEDFRWIKLPKSCTALPVYRDSNAPADSDLPDRLLFEGTHSGSGRVADWDEARGLARVAEVILAGGLTADNVADAVELRAAVGRRRVERRRARAAARKTLPRYASSWPACGRSTRTGRPRNATQELPGVSMETNEREALLAALLDGACPTRTAASARSAAATCPRR